MKIVIAIGLIGLGLTGCASMKPATPLVTTAAVCQPQRFEVYFADSQAGLTRPAHQAIAMRADRLKGCDIRSVKVMGLADARGGAAANLSLSERRAQSVVEALAATGWPAPVFEVEAVGDEGATTAAGVREPLRRRTEVLVDAVAKPAS